METASFKGSSIFEQFVIDVFQIANEEADGQRLGLVAQGLAISVG